MSICAYCPKPVPDGDRFCCGRHRAAWHRENVPHGVVSGFRRTKRGWSVTVRYADLPPGLEIGCTAWASTGHGTRTDADGGPVEAEDNHGDQTQPENAAAAGDGK